MNAKKITLVTLIAIVILGLGGLGGYFIGKMNEQQAIKEAKSQAREEALNQAKAEADQAAKTAHEKTPPKVVTETTCNADELRLSINDDGTGATAGAIAYDLVLTNIGQRTCILGGFPGVSFVNDNGNQIGSPANRAEGFTETSITLAPNAGVKAIVTVPESSNFEDGQCVAGATKFRVYPPNDTGYLSVASPVDTWCPGLEVSPVLNL